MTHLLKAICVGEILYDCFYEQTNDKDTCIHLKCFPGGAPANVSIGLSRLGVPTGFIGAIGNDYFGDQIYQFLKKEKVDLTHLQVKERFPTSLTIVTKNKQNTFISYCEADSKLKYVEKLNKYVHNSDFFIFNGVTLSRDSKTCLVELINIASKSGKIITFDINWRPLLWEDKNHAKKEFTKYINVSNIIKLNLDELNLITNSFNPKSILHYINNLDQKIFLITCGYKGAYYLTKKYFKFIESFKIDEIDDTGCGDSFLSAFIYKMLQYNINNIYDQPYDIINNIMRFSNASGAITATKQSTMSVYPNLSDINEFVKNRH